MTPTKKILFEGIVPATADIAQRLGLHEGDSVLEYRRVYYANGTPVIYGRSYFNASVLPGIESFNLQNQSIITLLKEKYDLEIHCSNRELRAVVSDDDFPPTWHAKPLSAASGDRPENGRMAGYENSGRVLYFPVCDGAYPLFARDLRATPHNCIMRCCPKKKHDNTSRKKLKSAKGCKEENHHRQHY